MATKHLYPVWKVSITPTGEIVHQDPEGWESFKAIYVENDTMGLVLKPYRKSRSRQEEKYYHAVPKMMVAEAMDIEPEQAHDFLCRLFLTTEESTVINGKTLRYNRVKSTTELDDKQYREFWTRVNQWASLPTGDNGLDHDSGLGIYIPDPNEADYENYY